MEDLAEQSVDDLMDIEEMTEERAAELIMTARAPWFAEEKARNTALLSTSTQTHTDQGVLDGSGDSRTT